MAAAGSEHFSGGGGHFSGGGAHFSGGGSHFSGGGMHFSAGGSHFSSMSSAHFSSPHMSSFGGTPMFSGGHSASSGSYVNSAPTMHFDLILGIIIQTPPSRSIAVLLSMRMPVLPDNIPVSPWTRCADKLASTQWLERVSITTSGLLVIIMT